ncbi:hypothetical protein, partial [Salmonella enterica]|uniref:hypothetical protein n=1 Tax=Salmonella enterica TaxID=28901 RepID=UPI0019D6A16E
RRHRALETSSAVCHASFERTLLCRSNCAAQLDRARALVERERSASTERRAARNAFQLLS